MPTGLPYFKFFPTDWRAERALKSVDSSARGVLIEALALMHDDKQYGCLTDGNGNPMSFAEFAGLATLKVSEVRSGLKALLANGVLSQDERGIIYSRRMVREAKVREGARRRKQRQKEREAASELQRERERETPRESSPDSRRESERERSVNRTRPEARGQRPEAREGDVTPPDTGNDSSLRSSPLPVSSGAAATSRDGTSLHAKSGNDAARTGRGLESAESPGATEGASETPSAGGTLVPLPERKPRPTTPAYALAERVRRSAIELGLVTAEPDADGERRAIVSDVAAAQKLLDSRSEAEITQRSARMFDAIASGERLSPTCRSLLKAWDYRALAAPSANGNGAHRRRERDDDGPYASTAGLREFNPETAR